MTLAATCLVLRSFAAITAVFPPVPPFTPARLPFGLFFSLPPM